MKILNLILSIFFVAVILGALGVGIYFALRFIAGPLGRMDSQVASVTAIASIVTLLAATIIAGSIRHTSNQREANQFLTERAATYQIFVDVWTDLLRQERGAEDQGVNNSPEKLNVLDRLIILYGSPGIVKAHGALRALEQQSGAQNPNLRSQFIKALTEIRKEIGSQMRGLTAEELQQLLLPDAVGVSAVGVSAVGVSASAKPNAYQDLQPRVSLTSNS